MDDLPLPGSAFPLPDWLSTLVVGSNLCPERRKGCLGWWWWRWGGEGESRQGCAKMELMVKIEMTAWT